MIQIPKKFCVYCKTPKFKIETTFQKTDICEDCLKSMIEQQIRLAKIEKTRGGELA